MFVLRGRYTRYSTGAKFRSFWPIRRAYGESRTIRFRLARGLSGVIVMWRAG